MVELPAPTSTNPRGIPQAPFLESVAALASSEDEASELLKKLQELTQKYEFMETATLSRMQALMEKVPDIQKSLDAAKFVMSRSTSFTTKYELNDTVYAEAEIPPTDSVFLWLGASTMLEYPVGEACELLESRLKSANEGLDACRADLDFLRENITTMQVNTARAINYRVDLRKKTPGA